MKRPGPIRRAVASKRNSDCGSADLADLDWSNWWTDDSALQLYLHVRRLHADIEGNCPHDETWHRVYCRAAERPRLLMENGKLYWLID